jgi:hypothetical protein
MLEAFPVRRRSVDDDGDEAAAQYVEDDPADLDAAVEGERALFVTGLRPRLRRTLRGVCPAWAPSISTRAAGGSEKTRTS